MLEACRSFHKFSSSPKQERAVVMRKEQLSNSSLMALADDKIYACHLKFKEASTFQ